MLKLVNITKTYITGDLKQQALDGIDICFRKSEFVSILGQSGSGKTTLLNIIGGLDQYTTGDLIINGKSTKEYTDRDWDTYRNHSVGFVFQSYNLIPHQSVLRNVELALTLSGVSKAERRRRALEALEAVGLSEHVHKRPNQMSGGQMQRVSIARALINDPDILLADEPTGALDSETSVQVMELLKNIAKDRLVVMVTHNPELAETYSTRIVRLFDGKVTADSDPYEDESEAVALTKAEQKRQKLEQKKRSMSFFTALSLSLNNLMTKKGRTFLTAFAGSIGIIGIALILSLSTGINRYIDQVQEETLSSYPITIQAETMDMGAMMLNMMGARQEELSKPHEDDRVYASNVFYDMMNAMVNAETQKNNLRAFKEYLDAPGSEIAKLAAIRYTYDFSFDVYNRDENGDIVKNDVASLLEEAMTALYGGNYASYFSAMGGMYDAMSVFTELMPGSDGALIDSSVTDQYEMVYGHWPQAENEVVLFIDRNNQLSDLMLYVLGLLPKDRMTETLLSMQEAEEKGQILEKEERSWSYEELCNDSYKLILPAERYRKDVGGTWSDWGATETGLELLYTSDEVGTRLNVVGIARPTGDSRNSAAIGYTSALTAYAIDRGNNTEVVKAQRSDPETDVFNGLPFPKEDDKEPSDQDKAAAIAEYFSTLRDSEKAEAYLDVMGVPSEEYIDTVLDTQMGALTRDDIEEMIVQQYASQMGVDAETILGYISGMTDEQLFSQVRTAMAEAVKEQYAEAARGKLASLPEETLAGMLDAALREEAPQPPTAEEKLAAVREYVKTLSTADKAALYVEIMSTPSEETVASAVQAQLAAMDRAAMEAMLVQMAAQNGMSVDAAQQMLSSMSDEQLAAQLAEGIAAGVKLQAAAQVQAQLAQAAPELLAAALDQMVEPANVPVEQSHMPHPIEPWQVDNVYNAHIAAPESLVEPLETWQRVWLYDEKMPATRSSSTYEDNLKALNYIDLASPSTISIYATTFSDKDKVADLIKTYNSGVSEDDEISYTDYIALLMSSITSIINAISYLLIGFVAISLVVSSIMIGVITYISVLERTKEIGILRAIGASKKDVRRVFNAETLIVGFAAGAIGIGVTLLLIIPINLIVHHLTEIPELSAYLPPVAAVILVVISAVLTIIAGLMPASLAAKKNPVEALRTE